MKSRTVEQVPTIKPQSWRYMRAWGYWKHLTKITGWVLWWRNHQFLPFLMRLKSRKQKVQRCQHPLFEQVQDSLGRCQVLTAPFVPPFDVSSWWARAACICLIPWTSAVHLIWYLSPLLRVSCPTARVFVVNLLASNSSFSSTLWFLLSSDSFSSSLEALQSLCQGACEDLYQRSILGVSQLTVSLTLLQALGHILIKPTNSCPQCKTSLLSPETVEIRNLAKQRYDWSFLPQTPAILLVKMLINLLHWGQP